MEKYWNVTARAYNRISGNAVGQERIETVNTSNPLFSKCKTIMDVKAVYERFWNDLNPESREVVFVIQVMSI